MIRIRFRSFAVGAMALVAMLLGSIVAVPAAEAQSRLDWFYSTKSYPYSGDNGPMSPAGYKRGWCVDYAVWAWDHWAGNRFTNVKVAKFKQTAINRGFTVSTKPKKNAMAVQLTVKGKTKVHMAIVRAVGTSTFTVREVRWNKIGPSNRNVNIKDVGKGHGKFQFFIWK